MLQAEPHLQGLRDAAARPSGKQNRLPGANNPGMKEKYGAKFVHLEDPEFERHFAVYADDEVEARMVLTPAMMRKLTALRKSFSRDLMLSFNGNMFYYASDTPDGFLRPGRKSLDDEHLLEQLYREVNFCLTVENGIK
ncbi:DUF3137 domain-containing protein [Parabacteroides distasonis]|uniref:DUF3137 domain-containing protein n=1 Tax=Parabacteroides distasonis TaxID=823 RepID=UPI0021652F52|nr:DUF3137 domain-containing protein [Parabacteroides distasonis]MCS3227875.1 DUF3137 domain-containing protein [Parabacteroides distasonis]